MVQNIFWTGYCNENRIIAINEIEKNVGKYGYITDYKQYSDISIMIKIEMDEFKIDDLYDVLGKYLNLNEFEKLNSSSTKERIVFMNVTFSTGLGDMRIEIPAVPG